MSRSAATTVSPPGLGSQRTVCDPQHNCSARDPHSTPALLQATLNSFMALGKPAWDEARATLTRLLSAGEGTMRDDPHLQQRCLVLQVGGGRGCWLAGSNQLPGIASPQVHQI